MTDRRRINGPPSGTLAPVFVSPSTPLERPSRTRKPNALRKIFLKTGLVPAASGSAYFELELPPAEKNLTPTTSTLKLTCAVHGPRPLPRNASFSPNLQLTVSVKFAPFATRHRRGYLRDSGERDLGSHLEAALKGVIIADRWPKSAIDVVVTILEGEEDHWWAERSGGINGIHGVGMINALAGCITAASAALTDARIDCLDLLTGGVMAVTRVADGSTVKVLDPCPVEHEEIISACVVGYLPARDEVTEVWLTGDLIDASSAESTSVDEVIESAVNAARGIQLVLQEAIKESAEQPNKGSKAKTSSRDDVTINDVQMRT